VPWCLHVGREEPFNQVLRFAKNPMGAFPISRASRVRAESRPKPEAYRGGSGGASPRLSMRYCDPRSWTPNRAHAEACPARGASANRASRASACARK